jgi:hypothetical protein
MALSNMDVGPHRSGTFARLFSLCAFSVFLPAPTTLAK